MNRPDHRRCRQTKEYLRRVMNESGMTQAELGKRLRVQQSIISKWVNGHSQARLRQLEPLFADFGPPTAPRVTLYAVMAEVAEMAERRVEWRIVHGQVVFEHTFVEESTAFSHKRSVRAIRRLLVHRNPSGFFLVQQAPSPHFCDEYLRAVIRRSHDESFIWQSKVAGPYDLQQLIQAVDVAARWSRSNNREAADVFLVSFKLRAALLQSGVVGLPDVEPFR